MQTGCGSAASYKSKEEILTQAFEEANAVLREHRIAIGELITSNYSKEMGRFYNEVEMPFHNACEKLRREYFKAQLAVEPESIEWKGSIWDWALRLPLGLNMSDKVKRHPDFAAILDSVLRKVRESGQRLRENTKDNVYNDFSNKHGGKWNATIGRRLKTNAKLTSIERRVRKEMTRIP
jgi:hypothetical protein